MPGEAVRIDAAEYILSPEEIILMLLKLVHGPQTLRTSTRETGKYDESVA